MTLGGVCGSVGGRGVDGIWGRGSCASDLGDSFRAELSESKSPDERVSGGRAILANKIWAHQALAT